MGGRNFKNLRPALRHGIDKPLAPVTSTLFDMKTSSYVAAAR
jgi:hypothetical protein